VQGDQLPINRINDEIVVPELRTAGKAVEVIVYPGQPHNFVFGQQGSSAAILKCFDDSVAFFKKHVATQPAPLASGLVTLKHLDDPAAGDLGEERGGLVNDPSRAIADWDDIRMLLPRPRHSTALRG
jgi:hypothetical protein